MRRFLATLFLVAAAATAGPAGMRLDQAQVEQARAPDAPAVAAVPPVSDHAAIVERVDQYVQAHVRVNRFSGTILLAREGTPIVAKGYGWANAEWEIPNAPSTKMRLGSITKQFTSMAIMQLQERGKLKVEDPICRHHSPCPDAWKPITIHHLLSHTSGIPSYTNAPTFRETMMIPKTVEQMVASFRDQPLEFEPGSQYKYNNSGYFLLGALIEKVTGKQYDEVLREQIFAPLGMKDSGYDRPDDILPQRASGYSRSSSGLTNARYIDMMQPFSAGALYSTVEDLLKWDQALYTDTLLPASARAALFTPVKNSYGYGWGVRPPSPATFGRRQVHHGGGINGFSSMIIRLPDDKITAIVLSNVEQGDAGVIARDILGIYFGRPVQLPVERTVAKVDPKLFEAYVGQYEIAPGFIFSVTREGDRLFAQLTGQQKIEMFPESDTKFFMKVVAAQVTFLKDASGAVTHLILHQGGRDQKADRRR
jgi:CubicO group peptidase (beta-lactamase class C family)